MPPWKLLRRACLAAVCGALLVHYLHALFGLAEEGQYDFVDTWLMDGLLVSAGGLAAVGAWRGPYGRRLGLLLAAGIASYASGYAALHLFFIGEYTTFPIVSDVLWLAFYPIAAVVLVKPLRRELRSARWVWLDGAVNALALVAAGWALIVVPTVAAAVETEAFTLGSASYMAGDLVLLGLVVALATAQGFRLSPARCVLAIGIAVLTIADVAYVWQVGAGVDVTGSVLDPMWVTAMLLIGASTWLRGTPRARPDRRPDTVLTVTVPPVVAMLALIAIIVQDEPSRVAFGLVLTSVAFVCIRLVLSLRSNGRLLAAVRRAERTYRELVDTSQDLIWTVDREGRIDFLNPAATGLLGYAPAEMLGRPFADLLSDRTRPCDAALMRQVLAGGEISQHQTWFVREDGAERPVLLSAIPRRGTDGSVIGITGTATDITARVDAEQERERLQVRAREVERLEALGRLVGGIAHDYNNLTAVILNYAEFVLENDVSESVRADVTEIQTAAGRAADLTRQLLIFGTHHHHMQRTVVDANEAIEQLGGLLSRTIGEDIDLRLKPAPTPARVELGPGQLDQVLMNFALNARDALPVGGRLTLAVEHCDHGQSSIDARTVRVTAEDTGCGITPEDLTRVFDPFFTTKASGTGLGLATVYGIVRQAHGEITVRSEVGRGTTFTVELPEAAAAEAASVDESPHLDARAREGRVLIVEDEPVIRGVVERILSRAGYATLCAADGAEAVALAERHAIDLVLTDVIMPGISGLQTAREIRLLQPGAAVLLMSGYTDDVITRNSPDAELPALLQKPFTAAQLQSAVAGLLEPAPRSLTAPPGASANA